MDEEGKNAYEESLQKVREVRVMITLQMVGFPDTVDTDGDTDDDEFAQIVTTRRPCCRTSSRRWRRWEE